jgi:dTDP-4-amino-4,6-dideoxygalactose transaminase
VHYIPVHLQPHYRKLGFKEGDCEEAERYYREAISLPMFAALTAEEQVRVIATLRDALQ